MPFETHRDACVHRAACDVHRAMRRHCSDIAAAWCDEEKIAEVFARTFDGQCDGLHEFAMRVARSLMCSGSAPADGLQAYARTCLPPKKLTWVKKRENGVCSRLG
jgi:hypothetical protein